MEALLIIPGLVLLIGGAEALVRGASRVAAQAGISPLVVGLTVVAFGTSSPELAVSVGAAWSGQPGLAVGNVVGSNIFNVLFILGVSALIVPLVVAQQLVRLDVPLMVLLSAIVLAMALDGAVGRLDGLLLVAGLVAYTMFLVRQSRREQAAVRAEYAEHGAAPEAGPGWAVNLALIVAGLALLVLGSHWLVDGATAIARRFGVSDLVIGLTIVAAGTSLPEVVTSIVAALRGARDIAVGNVVGSNLFNLMGVLGIGAVVAPGGLGVSEAAIRLDLPVMLAVAFACLPIFFTGHRISRGEGALFLGYYVAYTTYLVLTATEHAAVAAFGTAMLAFVIPVTAITLIVLGLRQLRGPPAHD